MITLHKLNGDEFILNDRQIEIIEERPDTTITLINERKYLVKESADEIINMISNYEKEINLKYKTSFKTGKD